jgi:hypothetical protein
MYRAEIFVLAILTSCWGGVVSTALASEAPGIPYFLSADVLVSAINGDPSINEQIYLAESLSGLGPTLSERLRTDKNGEVHLSGYYCLPMVIATDGGYISITKFDIRKKYIVRKTRGGMSILQVFGRPDEKLLSSIRKARLTCRID